MKIIFHINIVTVEINFPVHVYIHP